MKCFKKLRKQEITTMAQKLGVKLQKNCFDFLLPGSAIATSPPIPKYCKADDSI